MSQRNKKIARPRDVNLPNGEKLLRYEREFLNRFTTSSIANTLSARKYAQMAVQYETSGNLTGFSTADQTAFLTALDSL